MKRNIFILACLLAVAGGYTWYDNYQRQSAPVPLNNVAPLALQTAPDFKFKTIGDNTAALSDFHGKGIVLNFWASWCTPCVIEFPQMLRLAKSEPDTVFIFLSQDDTDYAIERFLKKYTIGALPENVFIGRDEDQKIARSLYQTYKLPETYLISGDGKIADKVIGADVVWDGDKMRETVRRLSP